MKKILFIAFAVVGFSKLSFAQETARPTAAPTKAETEKAAKAKEQSRTQTSNAEALKAPVPAAKQTKYVDPNAANYKKAGATDEQIASISSSMKDLDRQKAEIKNNNQLTQDQKAQGIAAIEIEKNAILKKSMGETNYKKYTLMTPANSKTKPVKAKETN